MAATYLIFPDLQLKYVHVSGKTHLDELKELASRYFDDPKFSVENRFFVDLTELTSARAKFMDVFTLKAFYQEKLGDLETPIEVAIVATTKLGYGLSRMFGTLMTSEKTMLVRVFSDVVSATKWLGVDCHEIKGLQKQFACL